MTLSQRKERNIQALADHFGGADFAHIEASLKEGFAANTTTGQFYKIRNTYDLIRNTRLIGLIQYANEVSTDDEGVITFVRKSSYRIRLNDHYEVFPYEIRTEVWLNKEEGVYEAWVYNGLYTRLAELSLGTPVNESVQEKIIDWRDFIEDNNGDDGQWSLEEAVAVTLYKFVYDEPEIEEEDYSLDVVCEKESDGRVMVKAILLLNGKELTENDKQPFRLMWKVVPSGDIEGIPGSGMGAGDDFSNKWEFEISNDLRNRKAYHVMNTYSVHVDCYVQFREEDNDVVMVDYHGILSDLSELLPSIDYYRLATNPIGTAL